MKKMTMVGIVLYLIMIFPSTVQLMEQIMIIHMLVQLPLFIFTGWLVGSYIIKKCSNFFMKWNGNGVPGIILIVFITTYWMFPRAMDEALTQWYVEVFKFISLPIVGLLLKDSWWKIRGIGKSFIFMNYLSMFALMGWLYLDSPIQLCNNYLETEQKMLGGGFLLITGLMILSIIKIVFTDSTDNHKDAFI